MKDAIIVGGGILGMLTARALHAAGMKVMLIDQGELGKESTWAGGGILSPLYPWRYPDAVSRLTQHSLQHYPALCAALQEATGIDPQWIPSGLLMTEVDELIRAQAWAQTWGYDLQPLHSVAQMQACEPQLATTFQHGMFMPAIGQVRNPRIADALRTSLRLLPIEIAEHYPVTDLKTANGRVTGVQLGNDVFTANTVILTTGAWTGLFPDMQALKVDIRPVQGQMILFRGPKGLLKRIVLHEGRYLIPRQDGRILCGSTLEMRGFDKRTTAEGLEALRATAYAIMPALRDLPINHHWSGLRPGSPSGVPYIDQHPDIAGLYVNAGHYRYGVTMALASVELLTDMVLGRTPCLDPTPYRLDAVRTPTAEWC